MTESVISYTESPFMNSTIYPVTVMTSCGFLDTYLSKYYEPYSGCCVSGSQNIDKTYEEMTNKLQSACDQLRNIIFNLNDNKLSELYRLYTELKVELKKKYKDQGKSFKTKKNKEDFEIQSKLIFVDTLHMSLYEMMKRDLDIYNKYSNDAGLLIDNAEFICLHKTEGIIVKNTSSLTDNEINSIISVRGDTFKAMEEALGFNFDAVFIELIHIAASFKHIPIGCLITDKRKHSVMKAYDYYNSDEMREMIDNGFFGTYLDSLKYADGSELEEYNRKHFTNNPSDDEDDEE